MTRRLDVVPYLDDCSPSSLLPGSPTASRSSGSARSTRSEEAEGSGHTHESAFVAISDERFPRNWDVWQTTFVMIAVSYLCRRDRGNYRTFRRHQLNRTELAIIQALAFQRDQLGTRSCKLSLIRRRVFLVRQTGVRESEISGSAVTH